MNLGDRVIVITGASSGFGESIARACVQAGARVALVARSADRLDQLAYELGGPDHALVVPTDVTDTAAVARMAEQVLAHYGRVDVLVNNAGYGVLDPFEQASLTDLQGMMDVNLYGAVRCTQALLPHMRARRTGQIVVVASAAGLIGFRNMGFYSATKFALLGLFQALEVELAGSGVRCAVICPGVALTPFMERAEISKYPRITRLVPWLSTEHVTSTVLTAIKKRREGRIIIPWQAVPLVVAGQLLPNISRIVMRLVR